MRFHTLSPLNLINNKKYRMDKFILIFIIILSSTTIEAQVGINTEEPIEHLDINGDIQIREGIFKIGSSSNSGQETELIMSGGPREASDWVALDLEDIEPGTFYLDQTFNIFDTSGVEIPGVETIQSVPYNEGMSPDGWSILTGLSYNFELDPIDSTQPTVAAENQFSTVANVNMQMDNKSADVSVWISFAMGIFVDDKLIAVRTGVLRGGEKTAFLTFQVKGIFGDLTPGNHSIKVGVKRRNQTNDGYTKNLILYCGKVAPNSTNLTPAMSQSTMEINMYLQRQ